MADRVKGFSQFGRSSFGVTINEGYDVEGHQRFHTYFFAKELGNSDDTPLSFYA